MSFNTWTYNQSFDLELGQKLENLTLSYHTYGELAKEKDNVVLVFHALTANSDVMDWWEGLFGENCLFNSKEYFIICINTIGSPYGSTSPTDLTFPLFTVRDVVNTQQLLINELGINKIKVAIGGSFGGSQALEFAHSFEGEIENLILIACAAKESAWGIAIHQAQRLALKADHTFGKEGKGKEGLKAARAIGILTYRVSEAFVKTQSDDDERVDDFKAASYIKYQGEKLAKRFSSLSYYYLHKCLDSHNVGRNRKGIEISLSKIIEKTLVIGIDTDQLLPVNMQKEMVKYLPNGRYEEIRSDFGHDGFLIEVTQLTEKISAFLAQKKK